MTPPARSALIDEFIMQLEQIEHAGEAEVDAFKSEFDDTETELRDTRRSLEAMSAELDDTKAELSDTKLLLRDQKCENTSLSLRILRLERDIEVLQSKIELPDCVLLRTPVKEELEGVPAPQRHPSSPLKRNAPAPTAPRKRPHLVEEQSTQAVIPAFIIDLTRASSSGNDTHSPRSPRSNFVSKPEPARTPIRNMMIQTDSNPAAEERTRLSVPNKAQGEYATEVVLPQVLWVQKDRDWRWVNYDTLSPETTTALVDAFFGIIDNGNTKRRLWGQMSRNTLTYAFRRNEICIGGSMISAHNECTWKQAREDKQWACDLCIKKKRPCIRLIEPDSAENFVAAWSPLPPTHRAGKERTDIGFWRKS